MSTLLRSSRPSLPQVGCSFPSRSERGHASRVVCRDDASTQGPGESDTRRSPAQRARNWWMESRRGDPAASVLVHSTILGRMAALSELCGTNSHHPPFLAERQTRYSPLPVTLCHLILSALWSRRHTADQPSRRRHRAHSRVPTRKSVGIHHRTFRSRRHEGPGHKCLNLTQWYRSAGRSCGNHHSVGLCPCTPRGVPGLCRARLAQQRWRSEQLCQSGSEQ